MKMLVKLHRFTQIFVCFFPLRRKVCILMPKWSELEKKWEKLKLTDWSIVRWWQMPSAQAVDAPVAVSTSALSIENMLPHSP